MDDNAQLRSMEKSCLEETTHLVVVVCNIRCGWPIYLDLNTVLLLFDMLNFTFIEQGSVSF
jgi:hypothetical protein